MAKIVDKSAGNATHSTKNDGKSNTNLLMMMLLMMVTLLDLLFHAIGRNDLYLCQILSILIHQIVALNQILSALLCDNGNLLIIGRISAILCVDALVMIQQC